MKPICILCLSLCITICRNPGHLSLWLYWMGTISSVVGIPLSPLSFLLHCWFLSQVLWFVSWLLVREISLLANISCLVLHSSNVLSSKDSQLQATCYFTCSLVGTQPYPYICMLSVAAFSPQRQNWVVETDTTNGKADNTDSLAPYRKEFADLYFQEKEVLRFMQNYWLGKINGRIP